MPNEKKVLGLENRLKEELESDRENILKGLSDAGIQEHFLENFFDALPGIATAIQRAAFFYEPIKKDIFQMTSEEIGTEECIELIELNPEYLSAPFAREHIRSLRISLYNPDGQIKDQAKDLLKRISEALNQKEKDHFPAHFIAWHRGNIKKVIKKEWEEIQTLQKKRNFLKEYFGIDIGDGGVPINKMDLVDFITARLYGLETSTVQKYVKGGTKEFDIRQFMQKILIMTGNEV